MDTNGMIITAKQQLICVNYRVGYVVFVVVFCLVLVLNLVQFSGGPSPQQSLLGHKAAAADNYQQNQISSHLVLTNLDYIHNSSVIMYNRVPKCGSTTMKYLTSKMSRTTCNNFNKIGSSIFNKQNISVPQQLEFVQSINTMKKPLFYDRHIHFVNFTTFGYDMPVYVNLIRDPIHRFTSRYHYRRERHKRWFTKQTRNLSINQCIELQYPECSFPQMFFIIPFFCGQEAFCREPTIRALNRAKSNVLKYYAVVGITEDYLTFLKVLENILPRFFTGVVDYFSKHKPVVRTSVHKEEVSEENRKVLMARKDVILEIKFYHFIKERLEFLRKYLNIIK